ncbi:C40 family peptidase [Nocardiopsis sp. HNM0947]|uniref:C40 family peptidase n=1 Tax=Nocardiopsis coralli TaxID=2772213 RepID=A0ABR9PBW8_9ACTN|nr:NlpC/P60 family protein [Nocardiopsis coralli]MBE3001324.1 C40 family peptidase [Nocardiopsis coralli]
MRTRTRACSSAALVVAFTALGSGPVWAEPVVEDRPPVSEQVAPADTVPASETEPSGSDPRSAAPDDDSDGDDADGTAPDTADTDTLDGDAEVEPFDEARSVEYFAVAPEELPEEAVEAVSDIDGVEHALTVDAARLEIEGEQTSLLGVDPSTFRNHAPEPSAESDDVWQGVAEGALALSKDAGTERDLEVGSDVTVQGGKGEVPMEVWTHATSGIAGIDALVSRERAAELGMPEGNALVVSAADADLFDLQEDLEDTLEEFDTSLQLVADAPEPMTEGEAVPPTVIEEVIANAETQLGVPYVWGGTTPNQGFDCSGLLQWAFDEAGVTIPRVTHDQWNAGTRVDYEDMERGDLIFWRSDPTAPGYISHVAIYLGDGDMLEAPRTGLDVRVTPVRTENFAGVVRVHA